MIVLAVRMSLMGNRVEILEVLSAVVPDGKDPLFRERPNQTMVPARPFRLLRPLEECVSPSEQTYILAT